MGLGAVEGLPLALSLRCCSLLELGQTAALLFDHLLTWRGEGGHGERLRSADGTMTRVRAGPFVPAENKELAVKDIITQHVKETSTSPQPATPDSCTTHTSMCSLSNNKLEENYKNPQS